MASANVYPLLSAAMSQDLFFVELLKITAEGHEEAC